MYNWSGVHQLSPTTNEIICPQSEQEIIEIIRKAAQEKFTIRPIGKCLSFEPINSICEETQSSSILLDLKHLNGIIASKTTPDTITVYAGTSIDAIIEKLRDEFNPPREIDCSPGVIGLQTIVGAISTGTHGQGLKQSSIADTVIGIRFVDSKGDVHSIQRPESNYYGDKDTNSGAIKYNKYDCDFGGFVTSLGLLSVIVEVTIRTRPLRQVTVNKYSMTETEFRDTYVELNRNFEFVKAWWFPDTHLVHIWEVDAPTAKDLEDVVHISSKMNGNNGVIDENVKIDTSLNNSVMQMENEMKLDTVSGQGKKRCAHLENGEKMTDGNTSEHETGTCNYYFCKDLKQTIQSNTNGTSVETKSPLVQTNGNLEKRLSPWTTPQECRGRQFETVRRFANAISRSTGSLSEVFCKGIPVPQVNCEIGIPLENFPAALDDLGAWWINQTVTGGKKLHYPFIFRCTGPSESWLSGSYGRDTCWIGFLVYLDEKGGIVDNGMEAVREIQIILSKHGGIPHLGKHFRQDIFKLSRIMEKWDDFVKLRERMDPNNIFLNKWSEGFLRNG